MYDVCIVYLAGLIEAHSACMHAYPSELSYMPLGPIPLVAAQFLALSPIPLVAAQFLALSPMISGPVVAWDWRG